MVIYRIIQTNFYYIISTVFFSLLNTTNAHCHDRESILEETIVTAQKREQKMQDTPISMSVLNDTQLARLGITSLDGLIDSVIPSLRINPNGNTSSSLTITIRGDGPSDVVQPTRQSSVAVYLDNIYLGRAQGLTMELADLQRIEVLRGPQGTLFGRNSTNGAVSLISHKPTGEFALKQTLGAGSYNKFQSITHINLPAIANVSTKFNYLHSEQDGWVKNRSPSQSDYNESQKKGGSLSLNWEPSEIFMVDYRYDKSEIQSTQSYFQLYKGYSGSIGFEQNRETKTRFPLALKPAIADLQGHAIISNVKVSDNLTFRSISAYRELDEDGSNNYGGVLGSGGIILEEDIEQEQYSQEFQLLGSYENLEWVTGLFYFKEDIDYNLHFLFSLTPSFQPLIPPVSSAFAPPSLVAGDSESMAIYGQGTLAINDKLDLILGARSTKDNNTANRNTIPSPNISSDNIDSSVSLSYEWLESLLTYLKWSTAYKSGGYNVRSTTFSPYDEETNQTVELGLKSQWYNQRVRLNTAAFSSQFKDKQFDFADPNVPVLVETLNAIRKVKISGIEVDLTAIPTNGLIFGLHYTYLDGDMPEQPHPQFDGVSQSFELIQTPRHSGSFTVDYTFTPKPIGLFSAHFDITSTSRYAHSTVPISSQDSYTVVNARLTLNQVLQAENKGNFNVSLWGRNLMDEEYANLRFQISATNTTIQSFAAPRTFGVDVTYEY